MSDRSIPLRGLSLLLLSILAPDCAGCQPHGGQDPGYLDQCAQLYVLQRYDEAEAACEVAVEYRPKFGQAQNLLGLLDEGRGNDEEAIEHFKASFAELSDFPEPLNNMGKVFLNRGDHAQACDLFEDALRIDPGYVVARRNRAICLAHHGGDTTEAVKELRRCLVIDPSECDCRMALGAVALRDDDIPRATRELERMVATCPGVAEGWYNLCIAYMRAARCADAVTACQGAVQRKPGFHEAQHNLGEAQKCVALQAAAME